MKKFVLLCTMLATLACLAYAEYQVNLPGYEAAKDRYYQLIDKVVDGSATYAENVEFSDLCQVYGLDVPVAPEAVDERGGENLDQGGVDTLSAFPIPGCPYSDTGFFDGDNDCSVISASPSNEVFYSFAPPESKYYQMRVRSYSGTVPAIRILRAGATGSGICLGALNVAFSSNSVATDCKNPIAPGMEPVTVVTYLGRWLSRDSVYYIHVGTSTATPYTSAYEFDLWCWNAPTNERALTPYPHNTCALAQTIACGDSVYGDSAYVGVVTTHDWYKVVVPDYSPMACSLYVFVGGRAMGHYNSGRYPTYTSSFPFSVDGKFSLWKERVGQPCVIDSVIGGYGYDDGCSYDAERTVAVDPGTYYIKVMNDNYYEYVLNTRCFEYNPIAACCFLDANCTDMGQSACAAAGGWAKPIGVLCGSSPCPTEACPHEPRDIEPNNVCDPSVPEVFCDGWYCGAIGVNTDVDWYKLVIADCESLIVDVFGNATPSQWPFGQGLNPYVYLYKSDCVTSLAYNDNNSGVDPDPVGNDSRVKKLVGPGTYYIKVYSSGSLTNGPYVLHITCINRECLPGDFCSNAIAIGALPFEDAGKTTCGYIDDYRLTCMGSYSNGPDVMYTIQLDGYSCFACSLFSTSPTGGSSYGSVSLYANCPTNAAEPCIAKSAAVGAGPHGFTCQGINGALPAGLYWIMVDNYAPGPDCINYTLKVLPCTCPSPCPYPNRDDEVNNNTCGTLDPSIACGEKLCGAISATTDVDWYKFMIEECDSVWVKVYANDTPGQWPFGQGLDPYAYLYKSDCVTLVASNDDIGGSPWNDDSWIRTAVLFPGLYYIKITSTTSSIGPYVLELICFPEACPDTTGETCADARPINALPYYDTWTTCQYYVDDYNATCMDYYDGGPDVLYRFEVTERTCATCSLKYTSSGYGGVGIFDGCPDVGICLAQKGASSGPIGTNCLVFEPGHVYYVMVDNWPAPACVTAYTLELEPCECPAPCESYTLCGTPGEVEVNNTCPPPVGQAEITCDATVYGLHCPNTDTDFWKVTIPPMAIMTIKVYTGPACDVNPPVGLYARYYDDQCLLPTTGTTAAIVITNSTASPLVKYLEVYDSGALGQTLYKVTATCCYVRDYCADPIVTGAGTFSGGFWTFDSTVNTCCATRAVDTTFAWGCAGTHWVAGPSVVFRFTLETTNILDIVATSPLSQDIQFHLFTDCANPKTSCVASEDDGGTAEDTLGIVLPGGTYYVAVMRYGATSCGDIRLQIKSDCPLPVTLAGDVVAAPGNEKVTLSWATASETNNDHFEIVRNGRMIGRVTGAGTDPSRHDYSWSEEGLNNGQTYSYTLRAVDINSRSIELATVSATPSFAAGEVTEYALHQNYPNPFNPVTTIAFDLLEAGNVNLKIYNLMGQEVRTVVSGSMVKGRHTVSFDAGNLSSGIYLYRVEVNGFVAEKKMLLMK